MTSQEFTTQLDAIQARNNKEIVDLVHRARSENADGIEGSQAVDFASDPNWQRRADGIAESAGWIYDRLSGRTANDKKNVATKIRRQLGSREGFYPALNSEREPIMPAKNTAKHPSKSTTNPPESLSESSAGDRRQKRLVRNEQVRATNKNRLERNKTKQRPALTTQVMNPQSAASRIKQARVALGMSQSQFAKALGLQRRYTISELRGR